MLMCILFLCTQVVSVIFQKAAGGVGIDPSSETDSVSYIETGAAQEWMVNYCF
jgi:hypothetical protein